MAPLVFQQIVNSPDDFNPKEFYNKKFGHKANGFHNTSSTAAAEQIVVGPMEVKYSGFSMPPDSPKNGEQVPASVGSHYYGHPSSLQSVSKFSLVWVTSSTPVGKKKDLHFGSWGDDRLNLLMFWPIQKHNINPR